MQLPDSFIKTFTSAFKKDGEAFLAVLPSLIDEASKRWGLSNVIPVSNLSFYFVAFAKRGSEDVILKMGVPNLEFSSEMAALKLFNGNGACQLIDCDEKHGFLLLERLTPGTMLAEIENDDERTHIAADVMQRLWKPLETLELDSLLFNSGQQAARLQKFIKLSDWFDELKTVRPKFDGGTGPFPKEIFERVESFLPELFADKDIKLIHGDFHHFNILKSEERGWLIIDPKGVIGPAGYEVGPLMINPWGSLSDGISFKVQTERRIDIFRERLDWERENLIRWSLAHSVLSAWWDFESGLDWEYSMNCARVFAEIR